MNTLTVALTQLDYRSKTKTFFSDTKKVFEFDVENIPNIIEVISPMLGVLTYVFQESEDDIYYYINTSGNYLIIYDF